MNLAKPFKATVVSSIAAAALFCTSNAFALQAPTIQAKPQVTDNANAEYIMNNKVKLICDADKYFNNHEKL